MMLFQTTEHRLSCDVERFCSESPVRLTIYVQREEVDSSIHRGRDLPFT